MPIAAVRGVEINYEVLGERGPWVALQPGGRRGLEGVKPLGQKLAEAGNRVLVYDRRNCGASAISFDGGNSKTRCGLPTFTNCFCSSMRFPRSSAAAHRA